VASSNGYRLLGRRTLYRGRIVRLDLERWRAPAGLVFARENIVHPGAVAILPITAKGTFLLVRQFRSAARRVLLEIPAGTLEVGEKPLACARRELAEEIGQAARRWRKLGAIYTAPGFCSEIIHLFEATGLTPRHADPDEDEAIEVVELSRAELARAVSRGTIRDGKSLSAILLSGCLRASPRARKARGS
jgi:ADP-ribose pyrophosphatase